MTSICGAHSASLVASRTPDHGTAGRGAANLSSPTGGAAYGMALKTRTPSVFLPAQGPGR